MRTRVGEHLFHQPPIPLHLADGFGAAAGRSLAAAGYPIIGVHLDLRGTIANALAVRDEIAATGVPVVDTMGVRGGAIHSPDEFMIVSSLRERAALSALVLHKLASGDLL